MKRIIAAVGSGYLVINTLTMASFVGLNATVANLNSVNWLIAKLAIALVGGFIGGYVAAMVAQKQVNTAIIALAGLMTVLSIVAIVIMFGSEPLWFQAALVGGTAPAILLGGFIRNKQRRLMNME